MDTYFKELDRMFPLEILDLPLMPELDNLTGFTFIIPKLRFKRSLSKSKTKK